MIRSIENAKIIELGCFVNVIIYGFGMNIFYFFKKFRFFGSVACSTLINNFICIINYLDLRKRSMEFSTNKLFRPFFFVNFFRNYLEKPMNLKQHIKRLHPYRNIFYHISVEHFKNRQLRLYKPNSINLINNTIRKYFRISNIGFSIN